MLVAETLAIVAVAIQFLLPSGTAIGIAVANKSIGLPVRWVVPLLLIATAGVLSVVALLAMYWRLAQFPISGQ